MDAIPEFQAAAKARGVPESVTARVVETYGGRVRLFLEEERFLELVGGKILRGEIEICRRVEQAETLEDFFCRRAQLDESMNPDEALLNALADEFPKDGSRERILERAAKVRALVESAKG